MSVKDAARKQYVRMADAAAGQLAALKKPSEGWLVTLRKALGMSGAEVAARMGVSRNAIYQAERNEKDGAITLKQMEKLAEALGGRFVYAVIPEGGVDEVMRLQARRKAEARIRRASSHMALESQSLSAQQTRQKIDDLTEELLREMPPDFWEVK
ncbi:MAG: mobile mystery protein A [Paracoccus sp. (in: a-proteobacteria)]